MNRRLLPELIAARDRTQTPKIYKMPSRVILKE
jgi:hypothetical protein